MRSPDTCLYLRAGARTEVKILYWDRDGFSCLVQAARGVGTYAVPFGEGCAERQQGDYGTGTGSAVERHRFEHSETAKTISAQGCIKHFNLLLF